MSVRQVWREAAALFWEYPVLWLPVFGADLISFLLSRLQKYVSHVLIYHLLLGPASVFGDTRNLPGPSSNGLVFKAAVLGGTLQWSTHFAQIILYTTALFMTAALVRNTSRHESESSHSLVQFVRSQWRAILGLSFRFLGLVVLLATTLGTLITFTIAQTQKHMVHLPQAAMYAYIVPAFCFVAYLAAPIAMRRIGTATSKALTAESTRNGRIFASLAVTVSALLGYCLHYMERSFVLEPFFRNLTAIATLEAIVSMLVAFPYVVLFIALTLIVDGDQAARDPVTDLAGLDGSTVHPGAICRD
jgi:hypothetical protein